MCKPVNELLDARKSVREVSNPISVGRVPKSIVIKIDVI